MIEKGAEVNNCIIMEGGRIMTEASLRHVITDRNVIIRDGRTMMGHENYPSPSQKRNRLILFC